MDTGVNPNHPDLQSRLRDGWNVYGGNADFSDLFGHGTMVAGVAAAAGNNNEGVTGVTWNCPIVPVRVGDANGKSSSRYVAAGILWAVSKGARVINVSFAPLWSDKVVRSAAESAYNRGSLVVISAGNSGSTSSALGYAEALFVGALDASGQIAAFSDRGPFIDIVAPGTAILSTSLDGAYAAADGTSFASPIVAGVAALALSVRSDLRPVSLVEAITKSAVDLGTSGADGVYGHGRIDAEAVLAFVSQLGDVSDRTPPTIRITTPQNGAKVNRKIPVSAAAADNDAIVDVVLAIDGAAIASDATAPFTFLLDTTRFDAGKHQLAVVATDASGNKAKDEITIEWAGAAAGSSATGTRIVFSSPDDGARVIGSAVIKASIDNSKGLAAVEWLVDGASVFASAIGGTSSSVSFTWRPSTSGRHIITLSVTDAAGHVSSSRLTLIVP